MAIIIPACATEGGRAMSTAELDSVEAVLEKAGKQSLDERELLELRRILYGKEAQ